MQSAAIRASVLLSTAKIESIEWKMDGEVAEGSGTTLAFSSQSVGEHTVVCTVNGVDSAPLTIQVTEPSTAAANMGRPRASTDPPSRRSSGLCRAMLIRGCRGVVFPFPVR